MDPQLIQGIVSGVIANGITAFVAYTGSKNLKTLQQLFSKDPDLDKTLKEVAASVANATELDDEHKAEKLRLFLSSPEVETIVRQIYASKLASDKNGNHLGFIRAEFLACLSLYLGEPKRSLKDLAEQLIASLLEGCDRALAIAIDNGLLYAHEAKSSLRHSIVIDELAAIKKNLAFLTGTHKPNIREILEFEKNYLQQVANRHGYITPPYFDAARKLPIDDIFVIPTFVPPRKKDGEEPKVLNMHDFLSGIYRAVLLGNPGAGKSTFTFKFCHDLATRYSERIFAERQVIPILVVLRDYGAEKKVRNCSILQFIETTANSKYQVKPPVGAFEYLLLNGRTVVIFDGLDELLDTSYRQEISSDIESFCTLYPSVPVLVTSREIGYEQAPLAEKRFEIFRLAPFDDDQVQEYVKKWFAVETDLTHEQRKQKESTFFEESRIVPDLRSNPLMLALLCNIYRGENYIPKNRPDVYEKCAVMLFERWDKSRGIHVPLPFEAHIKSAMMYLAHWIYSDDALQGGVTEKSLIEKATEYLSHRRFEDRDEAEKAAREFIEFCRGRAWVFTDTGTTKEGERLYQFTHRTFLEYFTAYHIVRTNATPDVLGDILLPRIVKREWDVVTQLAFQLQNKNVDGAGDELLNRLVKQAAETGGNDGWNLLSFAARCLEFMVPSPRVIRDITTACINCSLVWGYRQIKHGKRKRDFHREPIRHEPLQLFEALFFATIENRSTIADCFKKLLVERINEGNEQESLLALEIGLNLNFPSGGMAELVESDHIFNLCSERIEALCPKYLRPCLDAFWRGKVPVNLLIKWHGIESLFNESGYIMFPNMFNVAPADSMINAAVQSYIYPPERLRILFQQLNEAGCILFSLPPPWIKKSLGFRLLFPIKPENQVRGKSEMESPNLSSDGFFGAFAILAAMSESIEDKMEIHRMVDTIKKSHSPFFNSIRWMFLARFEQVNRNKVQTEMAHCGFKAEQQAFVWRWIHRQIDLVEKKKAQQSLFDF